MGENEHREAANAGGDAAARDRVRDYEALFNGLVDGYALHEIICDARGTPCDYRFLEVNPAFERLTGLKAGELIGRTVLEVLPDTEPYWIERYGAVALTGKPAQFEEYSRELDRYYRVAAYSPAPRQFAVVFSDITEIKLAERERLRLETRIQQMQKLESLGLLAGGIAHDFNNLLMSILGNTDLALADLSPLSPVRDQLVDIEKAARRAADLCKQLLAYSGKGRFEVQHFDLTELVEEMVNILEVTVSKKAVLRYNFERRLPAVRADATQIRQVVMNLVTNASEAIGDRSGVISVSTGVMQCDAAYLGHTTHARTAGDGAYVYLEVSDTGCGMDKETVQKVFDPFFSTKFTGRGLGMSAVLGIVRGHGGAVKVYTEAGRGTTFKVLLPAAEEQAESLPLKKAPAPRFEGGGTVLLVDDEDTVLAVGGRMLQRMGFDVRTAADGREALAVVREDPDAIRCVILDLTMPHMDGEEAFREIRRIRPDLPVVLSSGYNEQDVVGRFAGKSLAGFLQKPYKSAELAAKLSEVLEPQAEAAGEGG